MFECAYCNLIFDEKKLLVTHQKTKKCTIHRNIGFVCQKCFKNVKGYANILEHVPQCQEKLTEEQALVAILTNQLSSKYEIVFHFENNSGINVLDEHVSNEPYDPGRVAFAGRGTISFSRIHNYIHPSVRKSGIAVPQKPSAFQKTLNKHVDTQIMENHGHYLNDVFHKIYRLSDAFQFMSVKYTFETLLDVVWFDTTVPCFHIKDDNIYVLGKVQCQNNNNQKWFGDTFILTDDDKIVKCVWYKDFDLKRFFVALKPLLKDILNLYLVLVNWVLKHKKIKLKLPKQDLKSFDANDLSRLITETIREYKYDNLVDNIQKLNSYETFYPIFKSLIEHKTKDVMLYSNMKHVFKDELLPYSWGESLAWPRGPKISIINEEFSLMNMNDSELTGNYYYLMYYILPDSEKNIFISKE